MKCFTLTINDKDGYLEITATSKLPQLAAQLVKNGENILQNQIIAIKTKSSSELLSLSRRTIYHQKQTVN